MDLEEDSSLHRVPSQDYQCLAVLMGFDQKMKVLMVLEKLTAMKTPPSLVSDRCFSNMDQWGAQQCNVVDNKVQTNLMAIDVNLKARRPVI